MMDCEKCKYYHDNCDARFRCRIDIEKIRDDVIDEVKRKMISFHTDMIFKYGADIIEAKCDAFDELENWLKEQNNERIL